MFVYADFLEVVVITDVVYFKILDFHKCLTHLFRDDLLNHVALYDKRCQQLFLFVLIHIEKQFFDSCQDLSNAGERLTM